MENNTEEVLDYSNVNDMNVSSVTDTLVASANLQDGSISAKSNQLATLGPN